MATTRKKGERVYNFCAGPSTLPLPVLEEAQRELLSYHGLGASILEISHRSPQYAAVQAEAEANLRALLAVPADYRILFLPGGATFQFAMVPLNLLPRDGFADYLVTGSWGRKAVADARRVGPVRVVWDGAGSRYTHVPLVGDYEIDPEAAYAHFTYNETIHGVEWGGEPRCGDVPLVCDASSTLLSRPIPISRYSLIYGGAQKNMGAAGVTTVIIRQSLLDSIRADLPAMLDYRQHAEANSTLNTPPVFEVYLMALTTRWLRETFGVLSAVEAHNRQKSAVIYDALDRSEGFYRAHADVGSRSLMNVTWRLASEGLENLFLAEAEDRGLVALRGHRSVGGGIRASIYNAMPLEGVRALAAFMDDFRGRYGE